ncbi:hypothetical protein [Catenuloplanes atrovinosus]|uniref:Uncharacterized protein n=1 Tax=Catenuloplanes atrovinosus TaxID=137266 RepID=A0AAE3YTU1_9ACTN|nr:hypothetical protein [Catenuloplanes atrovinosus]MDR7279818.1 hypothetical protein [Catenuloplanes atrovinosus]
MSARTPHTAWCAGDHRCGLGEHRSDDIVINLPRQGRAVVCRTRTDAGREYAEVRLWVALAPRDVAARRQLLTMLTGLRVLLGRVALAARPAPHR